MVIISKQFVRGTSMFFHLKYATFYRSGMSKCLVSLTSIQHVNNPALFLLHNDLVT